MFRHVLTRLGPNRTAAIVTASVVAVGVGSGMLFDSRNDVNKQDNNTLGSENNDKQKDTTKAPTAH